jgi:hypothetical protein
MKEPQQGIAARRKFVHYLGLALVIIGFLLFGLVFLSAFSTTGIVPFRNPIPSFFGQGLFGNLLMITGIIMMRLGRGEKRV